MRLIKYIFLIYILLPLGLLADTYPEVVFDNSLVSGSYAKSQIYYTGQSWVENVNRRLLVSDSLYFTSGNALSLRYISAVNGDWNSEIKYSRQKFLYRVVKTDFLVFRIYVKTPVTAAKNLPQVFINQRNTKTARLNLSKYINNLEYNKWIQVKIPCRDFKELDNDAPISAVVFSQGEASNATHHILVDQIEFLPKNYPEAKLSSPAVLTQAEGYDKMVLLRWQLPLTPSIRYIQIYRSTNGKDYTPVGIKPIFMQSCLDDVPMIGQKYFYKITWLDYNYQESPFSTVKEVEVSEMEKSKLVDLVQVAHINYFLENFDVNSGMYLPFRLKDKVIVSTKETGGAILSILIGVEKKLLSRQAAFSRVLRIVSFLEKAQNYHGIYPSYFDGRKSLPEYSMGRGGYDVIATSSTIEALLVARQYFSNDTDEEYNLRNRITALYDRIDWTKLTVKDSVNVLSKTIAMDNAGYEDRGVPISGPNFAMNTYILALGSTKNSLPISSYRASIYSRYDSIQVADPEGLDLSIVGGRAVLDSLMPKSLQSFRHSDDLICIPILDSIFRYGVDLPLGELKGSLMDLYRPFLTMRPKIMSESNYNWDKILYSYVQYVKRRDNELGIGVNDSDIWGFYQYRDGNYRINPAIGPSAMVVDRKVGEQAITSLYQKFGHNLFNEYGFRGWLDLRNDDVSEEFMAVNQYTLAVMIENARTGFIWNLYEQIPEFQLVRSKLFSTEMKEK